MVGLGLVGVEPGEPGQGDVEAVGRADVADDHRRPAGAGVALGQQVPHDRGVVRQGGAVDGVQRHRPLHVPELADVVLVPVEGGPAEQRIADRLQRLLVFHHPLALVGVPGGLTVNVGGQDRPSRLLQLQEQHVVGAAALEQGDVGAQPDAADPDHLVGDVDHRVAAEYPPPVRGQGAEVLVESLGDRVRLGVADPGDQRRVFHQAASAVALGGELGQRPVAGPAAGPGGGSFDLGPQRLAGCALLQTVRLEALVGPGQQRRRGQVTDLGPVPGDAPEHGRFAVLLTGAVLAAGHPDAGDQPAKVPLPSAGMRLVEVVQVDDQIPLGRAVETEVAEVRVAADHRGDAGGRQPGDILRHHDGGAAQEPVRRGGHPPDPDRESATQAGRDATR